MTCRNQFEKILGIGTQTEIEKKQNKDNNSLPLGVKDVSLLEDLGDNGDSRVDGVGNDQDVGLGAVPIFNGCFQQKRKKKKVSYRRPDQLEDIPRVIK